MNDVVLGFVIDFFILDSQELSGAFIKIIGYLFLLSWNTNNPVRHNNVWNIEGQEWFGGRAKAWEFLVCHFLGSFKVLWDVRSPCRQERNALKDQLFRSLLSIFLLICVHEFHENFISWKTHFLILAGSAIYQIWLGWLTFYLPQHWTLSTRHPLALWHIQSTGYWV